jgi:NitT/TauT family transport system substrate-binding protein
MATVLIKLAESFRALFYAPFYATQALGFYARQGIEVEFLSSFGPGSGVSALAAGTIDITWGGPMRVMNGVDDTEQDFTPRRP